ncbi:DinB family protein [Halobacillus sp. B23F22_1]|uniref:DinB family protein n=1 Tax=Halobacillus sp. B23F22_1 TaxID=3459514 RepID=UPI00373FC2FA
MNFSVNEAVEILERTPLVLNNYLLGLSTGWLECNEGDDTWNADEVVGHLIEAERNNWMPRLEVMLQEGDQNSFPPFDRFAHLKSSSETSIEQKLIEFKRVRTQNVTKLRELVDPDVDLDVKALHPVFGEVRVRELLSTWVVHDLTHIAQINRVMAERYREDVGPWKQYLGILKETGRR